MKRVAIVAEELLSVGYNAELQVLEVELRDHSVYQFVRVEAEVYAMLMAVEAKQAYFDKFIRNEYANQCISV